MMSEDEGVFHGGPDTHSGPGEPKRDRPADWAAEWPRVAEQMTAGMGWRPALFAAAGSLVTAAAALLVARRRSRRRGVMAAMMAGMPSSFSGATEQVSQMADQVMKGREQLAHGPMRAKSDRNPLGAFLALSAVALAGWGLKRSMAREA